MNYLLRQVDLASSLPVGCGCLFFFLPVSANKEKCAFYQNVQAALLENREHKTENHITDHLFAGTVPVHHKSQVIICRTVRYSVFIEYC